MLKIGDKIKDKEDGDCYYEGIIQQLNPLKYKVTKLVLDDHIYNDNNGKVISQQWWYIEKDGVKY